ncbi:WSC domain-containing protein [Colletotrichum graminicola]|uniref:WSC domain-containing protein n=2 Tax=Colletotrichum graminicola TaxID=31870 RepID=E3QU33_COLGM|nr:WSC domain-containing protein [Colletotrichum graminicola M1.001]EFQ34371.1 WSC domain-containing protein [Colletotrichum graminicola M1.001]WDK22535.1 WSC domain-containing protein [Colletotrichum graminicola]
MSSSMATSALMLLLATTPLCSGSTFKFPRYWNTTSSAASDVSSTLSSGTASLTATSSAPASASASATILPNPSHVGVATQLGCYDSPSGFPSFGLSLADELMTLELCVSTCTSQNRLYSGLFDTRCYCGDAVESPSIVQVSEDQCNILCPGNKAERCGGRVGLAKRQIPNDFRLSIYANTEVISGASSAFASASGPALTSSITAAASASASGLALTNSITAADSAVTSTFITTVIGTITKCPPDVLNCPIGSLTTAVSTVTTTCAALPTSLPCPNGECYRLPCFGQDCNQKVTCYGDYVSYSSQCSCAADRRRLVCEDGVCHPETCSGDDCGRKIICENGHCRYSQCQGDECTKEKITCYGNVCKIEECEGDECDKKYVCADGTCSHQSCPLKEVNIKYECSGEQCNVVEPCKGDGCPMPQPPNPSKLLEASGAPPQYQPASVSTPGAIQPAVSIGQSTLSTVQPAVSTGESSTVPPATPSIVTAGSSKSITSCGFFTLTVGAIAGLGFLL